jgi:hypothetical protein
MQAGQASLESNVSGRHTAVFAECGYPDSGNRTGTGITKREGHPSLHYVMGLVD